VNDREIRPIFYMEHVAERALSACAWLIAAVAAYLVLAIAPLRLLSRAVELHVGIPVSCTELFWLAPALIGVRLLQSALHEEGRFRSARWTALALAFWGCGLLSFYPTGFQAAPIVMILWFARLLLLSMACWWLVNLLAAFRCALDHAWPGTLSMRITEWVLAMSVLGQLVVLLIATYRSASARVATGDPLLNIAIAVQIASWYIWPIVVLIVLIINRRALVQMDRGRCLGCGFELHGNFDAGCPECGWRRGESVGEQSDDGIAQRTEAVSDGAAP